MPSSDPSSRRRASCAVVRPVAVEGEHHRELAGGRRRERGPPARDRRLEPARRPLEDDRIEPRRDGAATVLEREELAFLPGDEASGGHARAIVEPLTVQLDDDRLRHRIGRHDARIEEGERQANLRRRGRRRETTGERRRRRLGAAVGIGEVDEAIAVVVHAMCTPTAASVVEVERGDVVVLVVEEPEAPSSSWSSAARRLEGAGVAPHASCRRCLSDGGRRTGDYEGRVERSVQLVGLAGVDRGATCPQRASGSGRRSASAASSGSIGVAPVPT